MAFLDVYEAAVRYGAPGRGEVRALDGVSLKVERGESVALVGESGCGKTTLAQAILGLVPLHAGRIEFGGQDTSLLRGAELTTFRQQAQMIFQDPFGSLNPRICIGECIAEVLRVHGIRSGRQAVDARVSQLLEAVGLHGEYASRYPHEFSGGQRQRIGIARALAVEPSLIIADEPVSALDVSVQVQVLNLMRDLQSQMGLSYLFVAHDLAVVQYMCDRVLVMYLGKIVEEGTAANVFGETAHPYSEALLSAVPDVKRALARGGRRASAVLTGEASASYGEIHGCPFHPRCQRVEDICRSKVPDWTEVTEGHYSRCHFAKEPPGTPTQSPDSPPPA